MSAVAASALPTQLPAQPAPKIPIPQETAAKQPNPTPGQGYGTDPDLLKPNKPGDLWPLTFDNAQRKTVTALADLIIPADHLGPAASQVGVVEMIDEWISAPYPEQQAHRPIILEGLAWLEAESKTRFTKSFAQLSDQQQQAIADDIHYTETAKPNFEKPAAFFALFRSLCASAYYATPAGWKAIGYVGNIALPSFEGPPPEVLERLGVTQTVK